VLTALGSSNSERGYPPSIGSEALRRSIRAWFERRFGVDVPIGQIGACIGTKEFVASTPQYLRLRTPSRDTVLYPAVSYPTYEMGAILSGCRPIAVPAAPDGSIDLAAIDQADVSRALLLWVNSPSNPTGALSDLAAAARWGSANNVPVFSDECYAEFTWDGPARTILQQGLPGLVAVHSLSKRSNLAGVRVGYYAGDEELVRYLQEVRKHAGLMVPGPAQAAGIAALADERHVAAQRDRYRRRLDRLAELIERWSGLTVPLPAGSFYLWFDAHDGWAFAERFAAEGGALVSPGDFYGAGGVHNVRAAVVQPDDRIELVASRLGVK
jgi:aspartate/methionine/tyrosine aminotransferase